MFLPFEQDIATELEQRKWLPFNLETGTVVMTTDYLNLLESSEEKQLYTVDEFLYTLVRFFEKTPMIVVGEDAETYEKTILKLLIQDAPGRKTTKLRRQKDIRRLFKLLPIKCRRR